MAELSNKQKKDWAKILFLKEDMLQKEIAQKVGVSENTISKWAKDEKWEDLRTGLFISKDQQIRRTYKMVDNLMTEIEEKNNGVPTGTQADTLSKLAAAIKALETEVNIAEIVDVFKEFINWLKSQDLKKSQEIIIYLDAFIKHKLKAA